MTALMRRPPFTLLLLCLSFAGLSCANQIPPSGGPQDVTGPTVVFTSPAPFSLNVSTDLIEIEFDEYVDKRSAMESVFISPPIDDLEYDWWGTTLEISFPGPLRENTTYVVSVGTDVTDLEPARKNRMERAFTFPFSTGPSIDEGLIAGTVLPVKVTDELRGVMVYAYYLTGGRLDTLDVRHARPSYITQAGRDGSFAFPHIRFGTYFVLSIRDAARNTVYDIEEDEYGVYARPLVISKIDTAVTSLVLQLAREDTTAPRLTEVKALDLNHIQAQFSEPIDTTRARRPRATITDTTTGVTRSVYTVTPVLPEAQRVELTTDFMDPAAAYRVSISGVFDRSGNQGRTGTLSMVLQPNVPADTIPPMLRSVSVRDSTTSVSVSEEILFTFTEPIAPEGWSPDRVVLRRTSDGTHHAVTARWVTEAILGVRPVGELASYAWYTLTVRLHGLLDWRLEAVRDSLSSVRFRTEDVYDTGSIEGTVTDQSLRDTTGELFVVARDVRAKNARAITVRCSSGGSFVVQRLKPGEYTVHAFRDRNGNSSFDPGTPYPFRPAERRSMISDTLKVRSRWPLEGVKLRIAS